MEISPLWRLALHELIEYVNKKRQTNRTIKRRSPGTVHHSILCAAKVTDHFDGLEELVELARME